MPSTVELGIDYGTSNIIIYEREKGIIYDEPAAIAYNSQTKKIIAIGNEAYNMIGKAVNDIIAIKPMGSGNIVNFDMASELLRLTLLKVMKKRNMFTRQKALICFPQSIRKSDRNELVKILFDVGMKRTQIINKPIANCLGAGIILENAKKLIVDISGGTTDIVLLSKNGIEISRSSLELDTSVSGESFTKALINYFVSSELFFVDDISAENIKISIGNIFPTNNSPYIDVYGRNKLTYLPSKLRVNTNDIYTAFENPANILCNFIQVILNRLNSSESATIYNNGIYFTGGGSLLNGLAEFVKKQLGVEVHTSSHPQYDTILGIGYALENPQEVRHYLNFTS